MMNRTYSELVSLRTFGERFKYLKLSGSVGFDTFGFDRYLNQNFYRADPRWKAARRDAILRDCGCDMGLSGYEIMGGIYVHHMNPITKADLLDGNPDVYDLEYLICTSDRTHKAIHYSLDLPDPNRIIIRSPNDTKLW